MSIKHKPERDPLIFVVNCDWRDIFSTAPQEFEDKVKRDHLGFEHNRFFYLSFAKKTYEKRFKNFDTLHLKTRLGFFKPLLDVRSVWSVFRAVTSRRLRPAVWLTYDFGFLPALCLVRAFYGGKIIMVVTNQPRVYSRTRRFGIIKTIYSGLLEQVLRFIPDKYLTINQTMESYLLDLGVPKKKIHIFSTDTIKRDLSHIKKSANGRIRRKLDLSEDKKIILSIGRLEPEKNFGLLLELVAKLGPNYVLVILGQGRLLPDLMKQVDDLGIQKQVFFEGFIDRSEIWDYYRDAQVFVLLSKAEALGMVFWEAMYLDLPVIGSLAPGIVETIGQDGWRGRLWEQSDGVRSFQDKVNFCLTPSLERDEMLARAKAYVAEKVENEVTLNDLL